MRPCEASEEAGKACLAAGVLAGSISHHKTLCAYVKAGVITPEDWARDKKPTFGSMMDEDDEKVMWNFGIKKVLKDYPNCPIKPLP